MASSILNSDDGVISGTAGLKSVGGDDGTLVFQSKGTETARINTDKQIVAAAGTASLPALTTTGDVNTGIFFPAADTIGFAEGGTEAMRIDSSGNVGIGTSSPSNRLSVVTAAGSDGLISVKSPTTDTAGILIDGGSTSNKGALVTFAKDATTKWRIGIDSAIGGGTSNNLNILGSSTDALLFGTNATERARITSVGDFLVGVTAGIASGGKITSVQSTGDAVIGSSATNASYAYSNISVNVNRSANSAYIFFRAWEGNFGDVEFILRGDGNGYADGTWNNNGADYAEYFESANGQTLNLGATVVLDGNKVREATAQDPTSAIIGVVRPKEPSKASMVVGNTAWNKWANKYLTDDFDRFLMEDHDVVEWTDAENNPHSYESHKIPEGITVPQDATVKTHDNEGNKFQHYKLNPAWNPDSEYVNRENRPEWNIIGLLGQVKILKGQPVGDRWVKMRDVSDTVEEWFIR